MSQANAQNEPIPREAKLISLLLNSAGVEECEPKVIQQLIEFMYRYTTDILQEGSLYSEHAGKSEIDLEDLRLAIRNQLKHMFVQPPSREFLLELAARKNAVPLPLFTEDVSLHLPSDSNTLLGASYRVTSQRKPASASAGMSSSSLAQVQQSTLPSSQSSADGMSQPLEKRRRGGQ